MIEIRNAKTSDADRLLEIYDYYVRNTAITFEYETPSLEEFTARIEHTMKRYPYLVVEVDGRIKQRSISHMIHEKAVWDVCSMRRWKKS